MPLGHRHISRKIGSDHYLNGRIVYIPRMAQGSAEAFASVFRWLGIEAYPTPHSDDRTLELGARHTSGDECFPAKVTVGDFLRVIEQPGFNPRRAAFFMPTADGPCRFGQYAPYLKRILRTVGYEDVQILSPTSKNSYQGLGDVSGPFVRGGWRALVAADTLRKMLLRTRPYEVTPGTADGCYEASMKDFCETLEHSCADPKCQLDSLVESMVRSRERFHLMHARYGTDVPLIGVVGEIFCRLNNFSNEDIIRKLESYEAEAWLSDIVEWIGYTSFEQRRKLSLIGRTWTLDMLKNRIGSHVQHSDEHALIAAFKNDFLGYEEPTIEEVIELASPYLPANGALGEMILSVGKAAYLAKKGADGIIDISPFTCMNGIVSEAIYPRLSKDFGGIPIRNFYFDGTQSDLDRDLGIYMELARSYKERKPYERRYPACFGTAVAAD
jgi:predicted nucleotide-binding protein (sugar kinase/HSP70/actin superfamily)